MIGLLALLNAVWQLYVLVFLGNALVRCWPRFLVASRSQNPEDFMMLSAHHLSGPHGTHAYPFALGI